MEQKRQLIIENKIKNINLLDIKQHGDRLESKSHFQQDSCIKTKENSMKDDKTPIKGAEK